MWYIVGMGIASATEAEDMSIGQLRFWYPLAKQLSDRNKKALDPKASR